MNLIVVNPLVERWKSIYTGNIPWGTVHYATLEGIMRKRSRKHFKAAKLVCAEIKDLMLSEFPEIKASKDLEDILKRSGFKRNLPNFTERVLALGGGAFKIYTKENKLYLDYVPADRFIPVSWNNTRITEADFYDKRVSGKQEYIRVEKHRVIKGGYNIANEYYIHKGENDYYKVNPYSLGIEDTEEGIDIITSKPLFSYIKLPEANNLEPESPTGISIFANAEDTLEGLDISFHALQTEIILGKKRIIVPASAVRTVIGEDGKPSKYFDDGDEVYQAFEANDKEDLKITDNSVELRIDEIRNAVQTYLDILSVQIGFQTGYLTFDGQRGMKTATEIVSENSKTQKTKVAIEGSFIEAITDIVDSMRAIESLVGITIGDFEIIFQDGIHQDKDSITTYWTDRLNNKTCTLEQFLMEVDNLTESEAKTKAELIRSQTATVTPDNIFGSDFGGQDE